MLCIKMHLHFVLIMVCEIKGMIDFNSHILRMVSHPEFTSVIDFD